MNPCDRCGLALHLAMLCTMVIQEISIEEINLEDERYRISEDLDPATLLDSMKEIGQLNPVLLHGQGKNKIIVCGFRRIRAMSKLGMSQVFARILPDPDCDPIKVYRIALWDNLAHRQLNPFEKARFLHSLQKNFGVPDNTLANVYLPLLGLSPAENVLRSYILLHQIQPALRQCFLDGRLTHASVETVAAMPYQVRNSIASLMERIRLSSSLQKKLLNLLGELAASSANELDGPLKNEKVSEITQDSRLSPFQKGERIYELLYCLRNPRLSQALSQFLVRKKQLGLPGTIRVSAQPFFEEPGIRIEFEARDIEHFRSLVGALQETSQKTECEDLFAVK
jgi:hypothetical protein